MRIGEAREILFGNLVDFGWFDFELINRRDWIDF